MRIDTEIHQNKRANPVAKRAAMALAATVAIACANASALARPYANQFGDPREYRVEVIPVAPEHLVPINGAQVLSGFGGAHDLVNTNTGEIVHR